MFLACGLLFLSGTMPSMAQVAVVVETNREGVAGDPAKLAAYADKIADSMSISLQGSLYDKDRTKGALYVMVYSKDNVVPAFLAAAKAGPNPPYRILYREDVKDKKTYENTSRSSGRIIRNGVDIGRGREKTVSEGHKLEGTVNLTFQKWDGSTYQTVSQWSDEIRQYRSSYSSIASGKGTLFVSGGGGTPAGLSDPPALDRILWRGFVQMEIVPGKLDRKTGTVTNLVKVKNLSPWPLNDIKFELLQDFVSDGGTELKSERTVEPDKMQPLASGMVLDIPHTRDFVPEPKRIGDVRVQAVALRLDVR